MEKSNVLGARVVVSDMEAVRMPMVDYGKRIKQQIAISLAEEIVKHKADEIIMEKRNVPPHYMPGETEYTLRCILLTEDEYHEFLKMQELKLEMKKFI